MRRIFILWFFVSCLTSLGNEGWEFKEFQEKGVIVGDFQRTLHGDFCYLVVKTEKTNLTFHCGRSVDEFGHSYINKKIKIFWTKIQYSHPTLKPKPMIAKRADTIKVLN